MTMAKPIPIANGIPDLITLGSSICTGLYRYLDAIKGRCDDITKATERLHMLQANLDILQICRDKCGNGHGEAAAAVATCLQHCENELQALARLLAELGPPTSAMPMPPGAFRKAVMMYPLNRKSLTRLEDQISRTSGILSSTVISLTLNISLGILNDVQVSRTLHQEASITTHEALCDVKSDVESVVSAVERTDQRMMEMSDLIGQFHPLARIASENLNPQGMRHLVTSPAEQSRQLRNIESVVGDFGRLSLKHEGKKNFDLSSTLQIQGMGYHTDSACFPLEGDPFNDFTDSGVLQCTCRKNHGNRPYRKRQRLDQRWGFITLFEYREVLGKHHDDCALHNSKVSSASTCLGVVFTGLPSLLSRIITMSLTYDSTAGAYSISPSLRVCNQVHSKVNPAFRIFHGSELERDLRFCNSESIRIQAVVKLKRQLNVAYMSGNALPTDVDENGCNIAHALVDSLSFVIFRYTESLLVHIKSLLRYLRDVGVNFNGTDIGQNTIMDYNYGYDAGTMIQWYDMLDEVDPETPCMAYTGLLLSSPYLGVEFAELLPKRIDIAEELGCSGPLSMAIFRRSESAMQHLLDSDYLDMYLGERGKAGQMVLHFCSNWLTGLRLLLAQRKTHCLLNVCDVKQLTPVFYALLASSKLCTAKDNWSRCYDCDCYVPLQLIFSTGSGIWFHSSLGHMLEICSLRARILFLEQLKKKRQQLQNIAMCTLSPKELAAIGKTSQNFPDTWALAVWKMLRRQFIHVPETLRVVSPGSDEGDCSDYVGLYHLIKCPKVAQLAFDTGFTEFDTPNAQGQTPLMIGLYPHDLSLDDKVLWYIHWLVEKGARLGAISTGTEIGVSAAHTVATCFGEWVSRQYYFTGKVPDLPLQLQELCSKVCNMELYSRIPCVCGTNLGCLPLNFLLVSICYMNLDRKKIMLQLVEWLLRMMNGIGDSSLLRSAIFRSLTMDEWGMQHLCHLHPRARSGTVSSQEWQHLEEEWEEILSEDRQQIQELEELVKEFDREYLRLGVSLPQFLRGYWRKRMDEIHKERSNGFDESQRQQLREIGVRVQDMD